MWLYPNAQLMTAKFSVANHGNTTAFVKIYQGTILFYYISSLILSIYFIAIS